MDRRHVVVVLGLTGSLLGCATPPAAREQANLAASMIGELELSLSEFRRSETAIEALQLNDIARQLRTNQFLGTSTGADMRAYASTGDKWIGETVAQLIADADALAGDAKQAAAARAANDKLLASLLAPLPSTRAATTDAQVKLAVLGAEQSRSVRFAEAAALFQSVRKNVIDNRKKIRAAEEAAARMVAKKQADEASAAAATR